MIKVSQKHFFSLENLQINREIRDRIMFVIYFGGRNSGANSPPKDMTGFCGGGFDEWKDLESGICKWGSVRVCPFLAHQESWILVQVNRKLLTQVGSKLTRRPFQEPAPNRAHYRVFSASHCERPSDRLYCTFQISEGPVRNWGR